MICINRFKEDDFSNKIDYAMSFIGDIFECHNERKEVVGVYIDKNEDVFLIFVDDSEMSLDSVAKFADEL